MELSPRPLLERKLKNADGRLKATYVLGQGGAAVPRGQHASLQDVLRVLWDWAMLPPAALEKHAPGE